MVRATSMARIFVSHSSQNQPEALALRDWLVEQGWADLFFDADPQSTGTEAWQDALRAAGHRSELVLCLVSPAWLDSAKGQAELSAALRLNKPTVGVLVQPIPAASLPAALVDAVDLTGGNGQRTFSVVPRAGETAVEVLFSSPGLSALSARLGAVLLEARHFPWPPSDDPYRSPFRGLMPFETEDVGVYEGRQEAIAAGLDACRRLREAAAPRALVILGPSGAGKSSFLRSGLLARLKRDERSFCVLPVVRPGRGVLTGEQGVVAAIQQAAKTVGLNLSQGRVRDAVEEGKEELAHLLRMIRPPEPAPSSPVSPTSSASTPTSKEASKAPASETNQAPQVEGSAGAEGPTEPSMVVRDSAASPTEGPSENPASSDEASSSPEPAPAEGEAALEAGASEAWEVGSGAAQDGVSGDGPTVKTALEAKGESSSPKDEASGDASAEPAPDSTEAAESSIHPSVEEVGPPQAASSAPAVTVSKPAAPATFVLPLDRAEELFAPEGAEEARAFVETLRGLLERDAPPVMLVCTLRPERLEAWQGLGVVPGVEQVTLNFPPLPADAYRQVIDGLSRRLEGDHAVRMEEGLLTALLSDVRKLEPKEALPLLSFVLERLHREDGGNLTLAAYASLGRMHGAVDSVAETALAQAAELPEDRHEREALVRRSLIPWMALVDAQTRTVHSRIASVADLPVEAGPLIETLVEQRLLIRRNGGDEATVELAHDVLLRRWSSLADWLDQDMADLVILEGVRRSARHWEGEARDAGWLHHRGTRLVEAERVASRQAFVGAINHAESAYLEACRTAEQKEEARAARKHRRKGRGATVLALVAVVAAVALGALGWEALREGSEARQARRRSDDASINAAARLAWEDGAPSAARRLLAQIHRPASLNAWKTSALKWISHPAPERILRVRSKNMVSDGRRLLVSSRDGTNERWTSTKEGWVLTSSDGRPVELSMRVWNLEGTGDPIVIDGYDSPRVNAAFSPDGRRLAAGFVDPELRIWGLDGAGGSVLFDALSGGVTALSFSPDSRHIAALVNRKLKIWTGDGTGRARTLVAGQGQGRIVRFTPKGDRLLTVWKGREAQIVKADGSGRPVKVRLGPGDVYDAAVSPDGRRFVVASDAEVRVFSMNGAGRPVVLNGHKGTVFSSAFSPDGRRVVTGSEDGTVRMWNLRSARAQVLDGGDGAILSAAFSPDGRQVLTASKGGAAHLWRVRDPARPERLGGHHGPVVNATFSPDGRRIVTMGEDRTARVWDVDRLPGRLIPQETTMVLSADGRRLATTSQAEQDARVWSLDGTGDPMVLKGHSASVGKVSFSSDGQRVVTASADRTARVWRVDPGAGAASVVLRGHTQEVVSAQFSPDDRRILTRSIDGTAKIWLADGKGKPVTLRAREKDVSYATFVAGGRVFVETVDSGSLLVDAEKGTKVADIKGEFAAMSPDGRRVATEADAVWIWNFDEVGSSVTLETDESKAQVWFVAFSADGNRVVWSTRVDDSYGVKVRRLDVIEAPRVLDGHTDNVTAAAFSPDGTRLVTASDDGTARVWRLDEAKGDDGTVVLRGHGDEVTAVAFSPDGRWVVTGSNDRTVRVWPSDGSGAPIVINVDAPGGVSDVAFSADGKRVLSRSFDRAWLWPVDESLLREALVEGVEPCLSAEARIRYLGEKTDVAKARWRGCQQACWGRSFAGESVQAMPCPREESRLTTPAAMSLTGRLLERIRVLGGLSPD